MTSLPTYPAHELATKADIKELRDELGEFRKEVREEIRVIYKLLHRQTFVIVGAMTALTGIFSLIVGLMV